MTDSVHRWLRLVVIVFTHRCSWFVHASHWAKTWLRDLPATGVKGLVFKGGSQAYDSSRSWLELKHKDTLDVVRAAVIGPLSQPQAIISSLPGGGQLRIVVRSTALSTRVGRELGRQLRSAKPGHPWPEEISETSLNRFSKDKGPVHLTLVEPFVVEVTADVAWSGKSFRHPLGYRRARPELDPNAIELPAPTNAVDPTRLR